VLEPLVLQPLVVGDGDAAGVADDIRDEVDAPGPQDLVSLLGGGAVGGLGHELHLETLGHRAIDLLPQGGGDADLGVHAPEVVLGDGGAAAEPGHRLPEVPGIPVHVLEEGRHVEPLRPVHGTVGVVDRQDPRPQGKEDLGGGRPDVAEALNDHPRAAQLQAVLRGAHSSMQ
jgi:hypothetical protein